MRTSISRCEYIYTHFEWQQWEHILIGEGNTEIFKNAEIHFETIHKRTHPFADVESGIFYEIPVLWAVESGITTGIDDTHFGPNAHCTRSQVAMFLWRTLNKPKVTLAYNPFQDVKYDDWFYQPVLWVLEAEITTGIAPNVFAPEVVCTRGQAVTFLYRAFAS